MADVDDETHLATAVEQPEAVLGSGYEKGVNIANHIFLPVFVMGCAERASSGSRFRLHLQPMSTVAKT